MRPFARILLIFLLVALFAGCDQATKSIAKRELQFSASSSIFGGLVRLQYAENDGGFLSIGSDLPAGVRRSFTFVLTMIVGGGFVVLLFSADKVEIPKLLLFSMLLAGSAGNLIDRLFNHGRVVDFLILGTQTIHTGILNVADMLITTSVILLFIMELFHRRNPVDEGH